MLKSIKNFNHRKICYEVPKMAQKFSFFCVFYWIFEFFQKISTTWIGHLPNLHVLLKKFLLGWTLWGVYWFFKMTPFFWPKFSKNHIFFLACPRAMIFGMVVVQGVPFRCAKFRPEVPLPVAPLILVLRRTQC